MKSLKEKTKSVALSAAVMYVFITAMLIVPRTADAMASYLPGVITTNHPGSKLGNLCANCHTDWNGGGPGTSMRIDYLLYTSAGGAIPVLGSPYYMVDADNDGASTGTEFTNSQSASPPALPNKWFPAYPDKDGDGCLQLIHRLTEKGALDVPSNVAANGYLNASDGFIAYTPQGWDVDDNDATQGCSTPWPTSSNAGTFNNPGTTSDVTAPAAITDFRANGILSAAIPLVWTATGDDGTTGAAHDYDLKYTTAALAAASLKCGAGTSACNVRDPAHWAQMYNYAESGDALTPGWNMGNTAAPLMRALYEPLPSAPGATQTCNALGQNCVASPGASYILSSKGTGGAIAPTNIITNGTTYWLAMRTSDGVTRPSGTLAAPGTITENASLSNIIAVTAGPAGTGAAISSISPSSLTGAQAQNVVITANGFGLNSTQAAQMVLTNSAGTVQVSLTGLTWPANGVTGSIACTALLGLSGTYNLELRTAASVTKAAWVNAITISNIVCGDPLPVVTSVNPSSRGQGATSQSISISGTDFTGAAAVSFGAGVTVNSFVVDSATSITANITVAASATVGTRSVTVTTSVGTSGPNTLFSVTAAPVITNTPTGGSYGVAYSHQMTASGGSGSNVWSVTGLPTGLSISANGLITGTPSVVGTFVGSVTVTDISGGTDTEPISIVISATVPSAPTIGTAFKGNASATVAFTAPYNNGGRAIINYTATASPGGITGTCMASPCTVTGLTNGTAYTFTVTATNAVGTGPASAASNSVTPSTVPGQVSPQPTTVAGNTTCTVNFTAPNDGGSTITSYTTTSSPGGITGTSGGNPATPSITVSGLTNGTGYTFTVYATNINGNGLSSAASTSCTPIFGDAAPVLFSPTATVTSATTATLGATITSNSGSAITARGTCWGTSTAPTTNCLAEGGASVGTFTQARTGLPAGTLIYYRGYATNSVGTGYSATETFTTPSAGPNVILCPVSNITSSSATLCANITSDGDQTITSRGFCLGTMPSPTNCLAEGGTTTGVFTQNRTGLTAGTMYSYRAFVTTPTGTVYTVDGTFTTLPVASDVDLVITAVSTTSASVGAGHSLDIYNTERNQGTTNNTVANTVMFYLSTDAVISTSDVVLTGSRVVPELAAGASSSAVTTVTVPTSVVPGVYYVGACADATNLQMETNEANNCSAASTIAVIRDVDLVMTAVSTTSTSVGTSQSFVIDSTEQNQGTTNMTVANNTVQFYLSIDAMISGSDIVLTGSRLVPALAAVASSSAATTVTVPSSVPPGTYYVGACADATYIQPETNEANNCRSTAGTVTIFASSITVPGAPTIGVATMGNAQASVTFTPPASDGGSAILIYTATSSPGGITGVCPASPCVVTGLTNGTAYTFTVTATNSAGTGPASASTNGIVGDPSPILSSPTAVVTGGDTATLGATIVSNSGAPITARGTCWGTTPAPTTNCLNEGGTAMGTFTQVRTGFAPGTTYFYRGYADGFGRGYSPDGTFTTLPVASDVDLVMTAVSAAATAVEAGNSFVIDNTETNLGTANNTVANTVMFYLSIDAVISSSDIVLTGSRVVDSLVAGASSSAATMVTVPLTVTPGIYYIGVIADATNLVVESNETNNALAGGTIAVIRDVDLVMTAVSTTASSLPVGASFTIDNTEQNQGTTNASVANTVRFYLSTDNIITTSDIGPIGSRVVTALAAGASSSASTVVTVPTSVPSGTYYVGACADTSNVQPESNETNNCRGTIGTVTIGISLTVPGAPTIGTATAGDANASVAFTAPASNGGSAITSYTTTSNPGGITGSCIASPCTVSGLTNGIAYTFTVTATNAVGTGPASAPSNSVTPVAAAQPYIPTAQQTSISVTQASDGSTNANVSVTFSDTSYQVVSWGTVSRSDNTFYVDATFEKRSGPALQVITTLSHIYSLGALTDGNYVFLFTSRGYVVKSASFTVTDMSPPTVPGGLTASAASATQINLGWVASTDNVGVTGYRVYRNGVQISTATDTSYSDTGLTALTSYSYTVSACDAAGNCSAQSAAVTASTLEGVPPTVPTKLSARAFSTTQINLTWNASSDNVGVTGYKVYRNGMQIGAPAGTSYSDTGLTISTSYQYTVAACDDAGNCSAQSSVVTETTKRK